MKLGKCGEWDVFPSFRFCFLFCWQVHEIHLFCNCFLFLCSLKVCFRSRTSFVVIARNTKHDLSSDIFICVIVYLVTSTHRCVLHFRFQQRVVTGDVITVVVPCQLTAGHALDCAHLSVFIHDDVELVHLARSGHVRHESSQFLSLEKRCVHLKAIQLARLII